MDNPFKHFNNPLEIIRLAVMMYVRYPPSLRNIEHLLAGRGIDIYHEGVVHNHFSQERHLTSRGTCQRNRSAAMAE